MNQNLKDKIIELFKTLPEGIGVYYGKKSINQVFTDENCIVFTVEKKINKNDLKPEEILPSELIFDGETYKTDVLEIGKIKLVGCDQDVLDNCYDWRTTPPSNVSLVRPLKGGAQINSEQASIYSVTLGAIVVEKSTQTLVGLTVGHGLIANEIITGDRPMDIYNPVQNEQLDYVFQPWGLDENNKIGYVLRYSPLHNANFAFDKIDAALVAIFPTVDVSFLQEGITGMTTPPVFATTQEIDNLLSNPPSEIISSGAVSGAKEGICGLNVVGLAFNCDTLWFDNGYTTTPISFIDCLLFKRINPDCTDPVTIGDSGSVLIAKINDVWKIIGLVIAQGISNTTFEVVYGVACRIDHIAKELNIESWDGTFTNYGFQDINRRKFMTLPGGSYDNTILCSGETYWQIGATTTEYPCNCESIKLTFHTDVNPTVNFSVQGDNNFDMTVIWGDGDISQYNGSTNYSPSHTYTINGTPHITSFTTSYNGTGIPDGWIPSTNLTNWYVEGTTNGAGVNAHFFFIFYNHNIVVATLADNLNVGYQVGDIITILGSSCGGVDGVDDIIITVTSVESTFDVLIGTNSCNSIKTLVVNGNPNNLTPLFNVSGLENQTSLRDLIIDYTTLPDFNSNLPTSLRNLRISNSKLTSFDPQAALPFGLQSLVLSGNLIDTFNPIQPLPSTLSFFDIGSNRLTSFNSNVLYMTTLGIFYANNNLLDTNNINNILNYMDTINYTSTPPRFLALNLQTPPAPPSGAAITSIANLTARNWIISTD